MKLSVIIIAKDAENLIADAISSCEFADEIIVIDTGSKDRTADVAKKMNARVINYSSENFSEIRNFGLKQAKEEWVFYLDTDERVSKELANSIEEKIRDKDLKINVFRVKRKNFYFGNHEWPHIEKMERLFKKDSLIKWEGELHETPVFKGSVGELDGFLLHYSHRDLSSMVKKTMKWSKIEAELRFKAGHPKMTWWRFPRVMITAFNNSYIKQKGYKAGTIGIIESLYQAFSIFITYSKLWELQIKNQNSIPNLSDKT